VSGRESAGAGGGRKNFYLTFAICWVSYAVAYFCRVNLTVSMPYLIDAFGWDKFTLGLVAGCFFWAYAIGQLINGIIGDKFRPRFFVGIGMAAAGVANIMIPFFGKSGIFFFWTLNGFFQSMLWGPIVRTVSSAASGKHKAWLAAAISSSFVFGSMAAYFFLSRIARAAWQLAYWAPGIAMAAAAVAWVAIIRNDAQPAPASHTQPLSADNGAAPASHAKPPPADNGAAPASHAKPPSADNGAAPASHAKPPSADNGAAPASDAKPPVRASALSPYSGFFRFAAQNGLFAVGAICLLHGVIKEAITVWGPMMLSETYAAPYQLVTGYFSVIPLINFSTLLLSGFVFQKAGGRVKTGLFILFASAAAISCAIAATLGLGLYASLAMLAGVSASIFAVNIILLAYVPIGYSAENRVSGVAGFLDFTAYLGAALAAPLFGRISGGGWRAVLFAWVGICAAAIFLVRYITSLRIDKAA